MLCSTLYLLCTAVADFIAEHLSSASGVEWRWSSMTSAIIHFIVMLFLFSDSVFTSGAHKQRCVARHLDSDMSMAHLINTPPSPAGCYWHGFWGHDSGVGGQVSDTQPEPYARAAGAQVSAAVKERLVCCGNSCRLHTGHVAYIVVRRVR
jgi:hypothetical protein